MTEADICKLFDLFDGEISMSDFSPDELAQLAEANDIATLPIDFKEKYFSHYNDVKAPTSNKLSKLDW